MEIVYNSIEWFLQIFGNLCQTLFDLMNAKISFGDNVNVSVAVVLGGSLLLALILYKVVMWLAPII